MSWSAGLLLGLALLLGSVALVYVFPHGVRRWQEKRLRRLAASRRAVVLTYDDGPGSELTPRLLDLLAARGVRASFFVLGFRMREAPEIVERARREGHEVGAHSERHLHAWRVWPWQVGRDALDGMDRVGSSLSSPPLYRPPYGKLTLWTLLAVLRRGAALAWWTQVSGDTHPKLPDVSSVVDRVLREGGGVILMHDFDRSPARAEFVLELTRALIEAATRDGLRLIPLGALLREA